MKKMGTWISERGWVLLYPCFGWIIVLWGMGVLIYEFCICGPTLSCIVKDVIVKEEFRNVLLLVAAGLGLVNMYFIVRRIKKTDKQIQESQTSNYLTQLHQGTKMLFSEHITEARGGLDMLHQLAVTHRDHRQRVEDVWNILCTRILGPVDLKKQDPRTQKDTFTLKGEILSKMRGERCDSPSSYKYYGHEVKLSLVWGYLSPSLLERILDMDIALDLKNTGYTLEKLKEEVELPFDWHFSYQDE